MFARRLGITLAAVAAVLGAWVHLSAQADKTAMQPQMFQMVIVSVIPGMGNAYEDFQKTEVIPALKKGGVAARDGYSSGVFGTNNTFAFFRPLTDLSGFDGDSPMVKALGAEGAAALAQKAGKLTAQRRVLLVRTRPDLSYVPNPTAPHSPLAVVSKVGIVQGRRADFEALIKKDVLPAMKKANVKAYTVLEVLNGDDVNTYYSAIGYDTYAAIGKGHPFQIALGEEGARNLETRSAGIVTHLEREIVRYRADLSFNVKAGTN